MFEYLMPRLLLPACPKRCWTTAAAAPSPGRSSTAASAACPGASPSRRFNVVDAALDYQYQSFGVPGLGLKRGLAKDLVIAPYATALALMVQPRAAVRNLRYLAAEGAEGPTATTRPSTTRPTGCRPGQRCVVVAVLTWPTTRAWPVGPGQPPARRADAAALPGRADGAGHRVAAPGAHAAATPPLVQTNADETALRPAAEDSRHAA